MTVFHYTNSIAKSFIPRIHTFPSSLHFVIVHVSFRVLKGTKLVSLNKQINNVKMLLP